MPTMLFSQDELELCREFTRLAPAGVVFAQPYLPYLPERWNGVLVIGCSENLGADSVARKWRERLCHMEQRDPESLLTRLYMHDGPEGRPWDNPRVRAALLSIWPSIELERLGFSNAVPWSRTMSGKRGGRKDAPPNQQMKARAVEFWNSLLSLWMIEQQQVPRLIITLHSIAKDVMNKVVGRQRAPVQLFSLMFPSPQADNIHIPKIGLHVLERELHRIPAPFTATPAIARYACYALKEAREQLGDAPERLLA